MAAWLVTTFGCRCLNCDKAYANWFWEDAAGTKSHLDAYQHILVVRVDADHWENRGPHRYALHHYRGKVVRSYKGDWQREESIAFVQGLDYRAPAETNLAVGELLAVLTNEHTNAEVVLEIGDLIPCDGQFKQVLRCAFGD